MQSPTNLTTHLLSRETSSVRNGLHLVVAKGQRGNPKTPQANAKAVGCSPQMDGKAPLLKTAFISLINHREAKLVATKSFLPY